MKVTLKKLQKRDSSAFKQFFEEYKNLVFYQCNVVLHNKEDSEDALQETFVEFFNKIDSYDKNTNLKLTLLSIAKYRALDIYRKNIKSFTSSEDMDIYGKNDDSTMSLVITLNHLLTNLEADIVIKKIIYEMTFQEIAKSLSKTIGETQAIYYSVLPTIRKFYKEI